MWFCRALTTQWLALHMYYSSKQNIGGTLTPARKYWGGAPAPSDGPPSLTPMYHPYFLFLLYIESAVMYLYQHTCTQKSSQALTHFCCHSQQSSIQLHVVTLVSRYERYIFAQNGSNFSIFLWVFINELWLTGKKEENGKIFVVGLLDWTKLMIRRTSRVDT